MLACCGHGGLTLLADKVEVFSVAAVAKGVDSLGTLVPSSAVVVDDMVSIRFVDTFRVLAT